MNRIGVSSVDGGPAHFTCVVNPNIYLPNDSYHIVEYSPLHGSNIHSHNSFDTRIRILQWPSYLLGSSVDAVVSYFRSIEGQIRYFNFEDIDVMNNWWDTSYSTDSSWKKARIVALNVSYKMGGKLRYETIELQIQPEV